MATKMTERMLLEVAARKRALQALELAETRTVQEALNTALGTGRKGENGSCTELVYGVLRNELKLDFLLQSLLGNPRKTPPRLRGVLRLGLYGLLYMDRTPEAVTVDACVHLTKEVCGPALSRVTNGVLRAFLRSEWATMNADERQTKLIAEAGGGLKGLSVACGLPLWLLQLWEEGYGSAESLAMASTTTPWPCVRVNAAKEGAQELREMLLQDTDAAEVGAWGVRFAPGTQPEELNQLHTEGKISRQGSGSQILLEAMVPHLHGKVWDGCAGFGGKTMALREREDGRFVVSVASDTHKGRLEGLRTEATRLGVVAPVIMQASATKPPLTIGSVDSILLDVPCSGLGTLARRPDLRRRRKPEHFPPLVHLQSEMLEAAWNLLPTGSTLVYATCAMNPEENERQVARFLDNHKGTLLTEHAPQPDRFGSDVLYGVAIQK